MKVGEAPWQKNIRKHLRRRVVKVRVGNLRLQQNAELIHGRGLMGANQGMLNQPIQERLDGPEVTADAYGLPFVGSPVEKRKPPRTGEWGTEALS